MRVAIDAMNLSDRDTGVGVWTRGLLASLPRAADGHEFLAYVGRNAADVAGPGGVVHATAVPVTGRFRLARILYEQVLFPGRVTRDGADVLHCPCYVSPIRARVPVVLTVHDLFARTHPAFCTRLNACHYRLMLGPSIRRAAVIHCTSEWTRQALRREFGDAADRAYVVHPCADDIFRPARGGEDAGDACARYGLREPPFLFVGRAEPKKGLGVLLEALALLRDRGRLRRKLLLVGPPGWRGRALRRLEGDLELGGHVIRAGYVPRDALPAVYRSALALVFPSLAEGFGLPPLEAMACGTPVIATHAGGLRESVGEAGLVVPPGDPKALADAMERLESSPDLQADLRSAGLARAGGFRWAEAVPRIVKLYEAALAAGVAV
jgi:glycosyltransferase involved in cell wall biosynthesis